MASTLESAVRSSAIPGDTRATFEVRLGADGNVEGVRLVSASAGDAGTWEQVVKTAVINKRAGGMGLITGRKAFQKPMKEGVELFHAVQDVYLCSDITAA